MLALGLLSLLALTGCEVPSSSQDVLLEHVAVFADGERIDGTDYFGIRVPAVARAPDGALLALAEGRVFEKQDPGYDHIDLLLKRSTDGGCTWSQGVRLDRHPDSRLDSEGRPLDLTASANPVILVDEELGRVFVLLLRLPDGLGAIWAVPEEDDMQTWLLYSDDSGLTWSEPRRIEGGTEAIPYPDFFPSLGSSVQLSTGRLVVPATAVIDNRYRDFVLYSDDHGETWAAGELIPNDTHNINEAQVAELSDGQLLHSARQSVNQPDRIFTQSVDGGETWGVPRAAFASTTVAEAVERQRFSLDGGDGDMGDWLLHTLPSGDERGARRNLDLLYGPLDDEGRVRLPHLRRLFWGSAGYSDLVSLGPESVGVFFEGPSKRLLFTRFDHTLVDLEGPAPRLLAYEGFDYPGGRGLADVGQRAEPVGDYQGGHAVLSSWDRTVDLAFAADLDTAEGQVEIRPPFRTTEPVFGVVGQVITAPSASGELHEVSVQRSSVEFGRDVEVYLHVYTDTELRDGLDPSSFLGCSEQPAQMRPGAPGTRPPPARFSFDPTVGLEPDQVVLLAFASSPEAGDLTTVPALGHGSAPLPPQVALGGTGFASAWMDGVQDPAWAEKPELTWVGETSLDHPALRVAPEGGRVVLRGDSLGRMLALPVDLSSESTWYLSLLVHRTPDWRGEADASRDLELSLYSRSGREVVGATVHANGAASLSTRMGHHTGSPPSSASEEPALLLLRLQPRSHHGNQVFLGTFDSSEVLEGEEEELIWTLGLNTGGDAPSSVIDRLELRGGAGAEWSVDELRVATSLEAVLGGAE